MKRILVFSDLHANKQALTDVIPIIKEVDLSIFCGDIIGYGKDIDYCIDFVLNNIDLVVLGNHDRLAITDEDLKRQPPIIRDSTLFTRRNLSRVQIEAISSLPKEIWYENIYVTHSLGDDYLRKEDEIKRLYEKMHENTKYAFFGHTHEQILYKYNNKLIINPGSISKGRRGFSRSYVIITGEEINFVNLEAIL